MFGGAGEDDAELADLWRVDRETLDFSRLRVEGSHPAARFASTLITDTERDRLVLFGGQAASGARSDVWELVETAEPAAVAAETELAEEAATPEPAEVLPED